MYNCDQCGKPLSPGALVSVNDQGLRLCEGCAFQTPAEEKKSVEPITASWNGPIAKVGKNKKGKQKKAIYIPENQTDKLPAGEDTKYQITVKEAKEEAK